MSVRYSPRAAADLASIIEDLTSINPDAAKNVASAIRSTVRRVGEAPLSGRRQKEYGLRKAVTLRYGFVIFYRGEDNIEIVTIQHGAKRREYNDA